MQLYPLSTSCVLLTYGSEEFCVQSEEITYCKFHCSAAYLVRKYLQLQK
jgi:hypothetical protein